MPITKRHQYINEKASSGKLAIGDTIKCYSKRELNSTMLYLSSEGYGLLFSDMRIISITG